MAALDGQRARARAAPSCGTEPANQERPHAHALPRRPIGGGLAPQRRPMGAQAPKFLFPSLRPGLRRLPGAHRAAACAPGRPTSSPCQPAQCPRPAPAPRTANGRRAAPPDAPPPARAPAPPPERPMGEGRSRPMTVAPPPGCAGPRRALSGTGIGTGTGTGAAMGGWRDMPAEVGPAGRAGRDSRPGVSPRFRRPGPSRGRRPAPPARFPPAGAGAAVLPEPLVPPPGQRRRHPGPPGGHGGG